MASNNSIHLTNLNIRQSISILLAKLIVTDIVMASIVIFFYFALERGEIFFNITLTNPPVFLSLFGTVGVIKIILSSYVVLQWLNEYYEITTDSIIHRKGIVFKQMEKYDLGKVRSIGISDNLLGQFLNFATITLFDIRMQKYLDLYLIHNPKRYIHVLEVLKPNLEAKSEETHIPFTGGGE